MTATTSNIRLVPLLTFRRQKHANWEISDNYPYKNIGKRQLFEKPFVSPSKTSIKYKKKTLIYCKYKCWLFCFKIQGAYSLYILGSSTRRGFGEALTVRSVKTNKQTNYSCPVITVILTLCLDQSQRSLTCPNQ